MSFWSSRSSGNPSLAWIMGNGGKGRLIIEFPFALNTGWYTEQPCTEFDTFEHRKERTGFRHEFIVLRLRDGSVCRIERMGDPNARFDALSSQGSIAYDMAQCFRPEEMGQACLSTSDVVAKVTLPCTFDIMDVLKICRAIHEGEKTRNYTLQVFNCYFFSLAIQVCLTRLVAHWEENDFHGLWRWLSDIRDTMETLSYSEQSPEPTLERLYTILLSYSNDNLRDIPLLDRLKFDFQLQITNWSRVSNVQTGLMYRINNQLWHSTIASDFNKFVQEKIREIVSNLIRESVAVMTLALDCDPELLSATASEAMKGRLLSNLTEIFALRITGTAENIDTFDTPVFFSAKPRRLKRKVVHPQASYPERRETRLNAMSFHGTPRLHFSQSALANCYPCISRYLMQLGSWFLNALFILCGLTLFTLGADAIPCGSMDEKLAPILVELEELQDIYFPDLEKLVEETETLARSNTYVWDKDPLSYLYDWVEQCAPIDMLKGIEEHKPKIIFDQEDYPEPKPISILDFQSHILGRIKSHAVDVERAWLGSAVDIEIEVKSMLLQVWQLIREDESIVEKDLLVTTDKQLQPARENTLLQAPSHLSHNSSIIIPPSHASLERPTPPEKHPLIPTYSNASLENDQWKDKLRALAMLMHDKDRAVWRGIIGFDVRDRRSLTEDEFDQALTALAIAHSSKRSTIGGYINYEYYFDQEYFGPKRFKLNSSKNFPGFENHISPVAIRDFARILKKRHPAAVTVLRETWGLVDPNSNSQNS